MVTEDSDKAICSNGLVVFSGEAVSLGGSDQSKYRIIMGKKVPIRNNNEESLGNQTNQKLPSHSPLDHNKISKSPVNSNLGYKPPIPKLGYIAPKSIHQQYFPNPIIKNQQYKIIHQPFEQKPQTDINENYYQNNPILPNSNANYDEKEFNKAIPTEVNTMLPKVNGQQFSRKPDIFITM